MYKLKKNPKNYKLIKIDDTHILWLMDLMLILLMITSSQRRKEISTVL